jgi:hypothetical protein
LRDFNLNNQSTMKQHIVATKNYIHHFKETNDMSEIEIGGIQIYGQADTITEFVQNLRLDEEWIPYGYSLRTVFKMPDSKNITAFLYRLGEKF